MLFLIAGLAMLGVGLVIIGRAFVAPRLRTSHNVAGIEQYGFSATLRIDDVESRSVINDLASIVGEAVSGRFGILREAELRQHIVSAGMYRLSARMLLGYQVLASTVIPAIWLYVSLSGGYNIVEVIGGTAVAVALGWMAPVSVVKDRAKKRLAQIDYALPELIDLIVVSLEAGIGFAGSLNVAAERIIGPLGEELRLANQEQRMGLQGWEALENFQKRCPTDSVKSFVRSVVQGERLGVSMGQIMRNLAVEMRMRRRQMAEEKAHKAPIKMLFPLVFMIFPSMFVVLLGPAMYSIMDNLGQKK
jgi:tight adherence protein C